VFTQYPHNLRRIPAGHLDQQSAWRSTKWLQQLLLKRSTGLNEQASLNGFVGRAHTLIIGILGFQPSEICSGDQSRISLLATTFRNFRLMERRQRLGRRADCQASSSA